MKHSHTRVGATHDARIWCSISPGGPRPYGWSCPCGAERKGYATGTAAHKAATEHNGGVYRG